MNISTTCSACSQRQEFELNWPITVHPCQKCHQELLSHPTQAFLNQEPWDQCPLCGASHLYQRKDFNQKLGIGLIVLGVVLAYFTYGLSLLLVTGIDWWLSKRIPPMGACYRCKSEFRNSKLIRSMEPFNLQLYDYYRNLR